jgi:uncharacterized protein
MLHPHTELRFVSPEIGYGIFATQDIPKGTITWVKDQLDRTFTPEDLEKISPANLENLLKYTYRDRRGNYFFCWDLTRFVNHSYEPNSMLTSMDFEIAIRDIKKGEEITNDYGTLNIIEPFKCAVGSEREFVRPDDLKTFFAEWDLLIQDSMIFQPKVDQPLDGFLTSEQKKTLSAIHLKKIPVPSIFENYFEEKVLVKQST